MEECYQTINMSANQSNPRRRGNTDIKWTVAVVVVIPLQTLTVCQMMFSIFGNLSTIATATHFNSYAGMKSTPAALLFARAFNPSSIPSLEITFIEKASSVALIISLSKSNKMVGSGRVQDLLKRSTYLEFSSS